MKPVEIEDLLGRDPIKVNMDEIFDYLSGKVILVMLLKEFFWMLTADL